MFLNRPLVVGDAPKHTAKEARQAPDALDRAGWNHAETALTSLASSYANAERMEEYNSWRHPVDLVVILEQAFEELPAALEVGRDRHGSWKATG